MNALDSDKGTLSFYDATTKFWEKSNVSPTK
ncbi:hypothetical protein BH11ACT4_BH11ACT4_16060 [soil metagenome]